MDPGISVEPDRDANSRRKRLGWIVTAFGGALMLWGVLYMTSRTVGGRVDDFAHRRTYDNTKAVAHQAFPGFLWRAMLGLTLVIAGARLRRIDAPA